MSLCEYDLGYVAAWSQFGFIVSIISSCAIGQVIWQQRRVDGYWRYMYLPLLCIYYSLFVFSIASPCPVNLLGQLQLAVLMPSLALAVVPLLIEWRAIGFAFSPSDKTKSLRAKSIGNIFFVCILIIFVLSTVLLFYVIKYNLLALDEIGGGNKIHLF